MAPGRKKIAKRFKIPPPADGGAADAEAALYKELLTPASGADPAKFDEENGAE
jgi:hypothetical protein